MGATPKRTARQLGRVFPGHRTPPCKHGQTSLAMPPASTATFLSCTPLPQMADSRGDLRGLRPAHGLEGEAGPDVRRRRRALSAKP